MLVRLCASGSYIKYQCKSKALGTSSILNVYIIKKILRSHTRLPTKPQTHARRHSAKPELLSLGCVLRFISALSRWYLSHCTEQGWLRKKSKKLFISVNSVWLPYATSRNTWHKEKLLWAECITINNTLVFLIFRWLQDFHEFQVHVNFHSKDKCNFEEDELKLSNTCGEQVTKMYLISKQPQLPPAC